MSPAASWSDVPRRAREGERTVNLETARTDLGLSVEQLWLEYFALGGNGGPDDVRRWLADGRGVPSRDHNVLAQALNEEYSTRGRNHPVPFR